jgi:DNA-binding Xre family transcriptional regulator
MALRHNIRETAEQKGFSRTKLSRRAEVNYKTINELWRDPYRVVNTEILYRIAQALGVRVADLLEEEGDEQ